jgi:hypothetical protein
MQFARDFFADIDNVRRAVEDHHRAEQTEPDVFRQRRVGGLLTGRDQATEFAFSSPMKFA